MVSSSNPNYHLERKADELIDHVKGFKHTAWWILSVLVLILIGGIYVGLKL